MNIICCCQYYSVLCYNNPVANIGERATIHLSPFAISDHQQAMGLHAGLTHFGDPRSSRNSSLTAWQILQGNQSHYREVPRWEILMKQELRFWLDLGRLVVLKKRVWANYEQLLKVFFSCFRGKKNVKIFFKKVA